MKCIVFLVVVLSGCVESPMWESAEFVCSDNDGVNLVWYDGEVRCNNDAVFSKDTMKNLDKGE